MKVRYVGPSQQVKSLTDHQIYSIEQEKGAPLNSWDELENTIFYGSAQDVENLKCPKCGGPLTVRFEKSESCLTIECQQCGARSHGDKCLLVPKDLQERTVNLMTADELKSYMLDDFVYDSPTLQFAIYPGIKDGFSYSCTTDIYGKTDEPTQDFKSFEEMLNNFMIGHRTLKEVLPYVDIIYIG